SPDGNRLLTVAGSGVSIWDVAFDLHKCPSWLLSISECLSGKRINTEGILEQTPLDRISIITRLRDDFAKLPEDGDGMIWGRWLLADHSTRTVSPYSKLALSSGGMAQKNEQLMSPGSGVAKPPELGRFRRPNSLLKNALQLLDSGKVGEAEAKFREALQAA